MDSLLHKAVFGTSERAINLRAIGVALYIALAVPLVLVIAYTLNQLYQQRIQDNAISQVSRELALQVGETQSLMSALAGMHYANPGENDDVVITFAEQLRASNPMITAIGRYRTLTVDDRPRFEQTMSERGLYNYRIADIADSGERVIAPERSLALPVSMLAPMSPDLLALLGSDLSAHAELATELNAIAKERRDTLVSVPDSWPAAGQLMLFRPVYQSLFVPDGTEDRIEQSDGGFWVIINPAILLGEPTESPSGYTRALELHSPLGYQKIIEHEASAQRELWFQSFFEPRTTQQLYRLGDSHLKLVLTANVGILPAFLLATLALLTLSTLSLMLALAHARQHRMALLEREISRDTLLAEREKAARTLDAIGDAVLSFDPDMRILHVNPSAVQLLGASAHELIGADLNDYLKLQYLDADRTPFDLQLALGRLATNHRLDVDLTPDESANDDYSDGDARVLRTSLSVTGEDQSTGILVLRDTSAESKLNRALEHQANHDALTGCTNRFHFEGRLQELVTSKRSSDSQHALLYMDLDQFKVVNDTAGHSAGDRLLVELTENLRKICRDGDTLSRIGGDEFGLIMTNVDADEALGVAQKIYQLFQSLVFTDSGRAFPVRASLGLVHFDEASDSVASVLAAADMACYAAKELGRNELFVYSADDETIAKRSSELNWLPRLKEALDQELFRLHAQPLATVSTGRMAYFEFLLRLKDPEGNETSPWRIIQAAERYGLMRDIDRWIISRSLAMIASLDNQSDDMRFAINLSGQSAADSGLIEFISEQFKEHGVDPGRLTFEITETAAITHFATAVELAKGIRKLGSLLALDDFGSGLSSFGYLKNLPVDVLKIDGQFIRDIASNPIDKAMVKAIKDVAESMQLVTVAEYVEESDILEVVTDIGIDLAQGYFIGKPLPLPEALEHARAHNAALDDQPKVA